LRPPAESASLRHGAGKAWLARIAARQVDQEPIASPQVAAAQLPALKAWGQVHGERYGSLRNIPHRTLVVNGHDDIMVLTVNSFILQFAPAQPRHPCTRVV
jgi:hypothetical protein